MIDSFCESTFFRQIQDAVGELVSGSLDFTHGLMIRYGESWFWPKG